MDISRSPGPIVRRMLQPSVFTRPPIQIRYRGLHDERLLDLSEVQSVIKLHLWREFIDPREIAVVFHHGGF